MSRQRSQRRRRRTETFAGRNYEPYALAIGQLTLAWNDLHEDLALLFCESARERQSLSGNGYLEFFPL